MTAQATLQQQEAKKISDIAITIGADGWPLIAYRSGDNIKVLHCNDPACVSSAPISEIDQGITVSAATAADGLPLIAYISRDDARQNELLAKVAHCQDAECQGFTTSVITNARSVSVAAGSDNLGILSYVTDDNLLGFAHCVDLDCTSATTSTSPIPGPAISHALTIGGDGLPFVTAAVGGVALDHHTAHCTNVECTTFETFQPGTAGFVKSATVNESGYPVVAFNRFDIVKLLRCEDFSCSSSSEQTYRDIGDKTQDTGVAIWENGSTLVTMVDIWQGWFEAVWQKAVGVDRVAVAIDNFEPDGPRVGQVHALVIGGDGLPFIAYATPEDELKVVHCRDVGCGDRTVQTFEP
jgi:hypothetical protein